MGLDDASCVSNLDCCHETSTKGLSSALFASSRSESGCDGVDELKSRWSESPKSLEADPDETDPVEVGPGLAKEAKNINTVYLLYVIYLYRVMQKSTFGLRK